MYICTLHLHHNESRPRLYCSLPLLPLSCLWSWACRSCCFSFSVTWNVQRHSGVCSRGDPRRMCELHDCSNFRWASRLFFNANLLHAGQHSNWNSLGQPGLRYDKQLSYFPPGSIGVLRYSDARALWMVERASKLTSSVILRPLKTRGKINGRETHHFYI
jgi:hypothetical protein